jgi:HlyD family secretion protein
MIYQSVYLRAANLHRRIPHRRAILLGSAVLVVSACTALLINAGGSREQGEVAGNDKPRIVAAGPGRIEPSSEDIKLGAELNGRLAEVRVEEGEAITRGQILAVLENAEYAAAVRSAEAEVRMKEAALRKLMNGARAQERSAAIAATNEAEAVFRNAELELERRRKLAIEQAISKTEFDAYVRAERVARAQLQRARYQQSLIVDPAREEDRAMAEAELDLSRARLEEARARHEKSLVRSPIDGSVLRKHHRVGESVSSSSTLPDPILTVGNTQKLRVRIEIDETDIGRVRESQRAYVGADAFGARKFWGTVVQIGEQLGRRNIRTDQPTERVDNNVLEVVADLDPGAELPVGLRVDAFVVDAPTGGKQTSSSRPLAAEARREASPSPM